jgi:hypothetical protein
MQGHLISRSTGIIDINNGSSSAMLPLDQELRSEDSSSIENISVEECNNLCSLKNSCRVASMNEEKLCYHYMGGELGNWKSDKITSGSQWFAKLQNYGMSIFHHYN